MLLTMGVRDCPEQVEVYSQVMEVAKGLWLLLCVIGVAYLDEWESMCEGDFFCEQFGVVDIIVFCSTFNLFRYIMVPTWRDLYPKISFQSFLIACFLDFHLTAWRCRCSGKECIQSVFPNVSLAATVREGGQIDVRPDPAFVSHLVSDSINHSFIQSFIHSIIHSFNHSFIDN